METTISIDLLKPISDKNFAKGLPVYTIDFDEMKTEMPEVDELTLLGILPRNGFYELAFIHPKRGTGRWLSLGMTKGQLNKLQISIAK
jgi:hypothetical protein